MKTLPRVATEMALRVLTPDLSSTLRITRQAAPILGPEVTRSHKAALVGRRAGFYG
jgi:hypothetical protein